MELELPTQKSAEEAFVASFVTLSGSGFAEPARHSFTERTTAAADAGFQGIGIHVDDMATDDDAELTRRDAVLNRVGLSVAEIEFLTGWTNGVNPTTHAVAFPLAAHWGAHHVSIGEFAGGTLDLPRAALALAQLGAEAAKHSVTLALEAFPWSSIDSYPKALDLIKASGAENVGLLVDVWHFFNTGCDPSFLEGLERHHIAAVQLNDGPRVHKDFLQQARRTRMLPGQGELDVIGLVEGLLALGYEGPWFLEVNTPEFRALSARDQAEQSIAAGRHVVLSARGSLVINPSK